MAEAVYALCGGTSLICALLLLRGYRSTRTPLLFWAGLCFVGWTANNVLLWIDLLIVPEIDLAPWRALVALLAMGALIFGLVWQEPQ